MNKIIIKKIFSLILLLIILSNVVLASAVSDNDGAAFITKAEFDSLKNTFQARLNEYNSGIDNKIESAISAYISGAKEEKTSNLTSILNKINQKFVDSKTLNWPKSQLDMYYKYFINLGMMAGRWTTANSFSQVQYLTGAINAPNWRTVGSTSGKGVYYYGTKTDDGYYVMTNYTNSMPYSSLMGVFTTAGSWDGTDSSISVQSKTFTNVDTTAFSTSDDTWWFKVAGIEKTINVTKAFGVDDVFYSPTLNCITGNQLIRDDNSDGTDDDVYFVEATNINVPGNTLIDAQTEYLGYECRGYNSSTGEGVTYKGWTVTTSANTKLRIYRHKYSTIKRNKILNDDATKASNVNVFYYNGLPIFKNVDKKGKITLKLRFSNSGSKQTVFKIQNSPFDNTALSTTGYTTLYHVGNLMIANNNALITINIDNVQANEMWWIKARPLGSNDMSYPTLITTEQITLSYN